MENKLEILSQIYEDEKLAGEVCSKKDFAEKVGVNDKVMQRALNGDTASLTDKLVAKVIAYHKSKGSDVPTFDKVKLIPINAHGGSLSDYRDEGCKEEDCEWVTSPVRGAQYAIQVTGDSMSPEYPNGSVVLIKQINEAAFIEWGKVYVLDTDNGIVIKELRPCPADENKVECHSLNPHPRFAPYTIERKYIKGWYRVLMQMALK